LIIIIYGVALSRSQIPTTMLRALLSFGQRNTEYIFPTVDPTKDGPDCKQDCADCTVEFPSKVKIESLTPLYGHIKRFDTHVLVATGKSDWVERATQEKGSLMEALDSVKPRQGVRLSPELYVSSSDRSSE
jgi:hypothetical protein